QAAPDVRAFLAGAVAAGERAAPFGKAARAKGFSIGACRGCARAGTADGGGGSGIRRIRAGRCGTVGTGGSSGTGAGRRNAGVTILVRAAGGASRRRVVPGSARREAHRAIWRRLATAARGRLDVSTARVCDGVALIVDGIDTGCAAT